MFKAIDCTNRIEMVFPSILLLVLYNQSIILQLHCNIALRQPESSATTLIRCFLFEKSVSEKNDYDLIFRREHAGGLAPPLPKVIKGLSASSEQTISSFSSI